MPSVLLEIKESVAILTLNRPDKLNAFNRDMALTLQEKLDQCKNDQSIRCVYITGAGKAFCTGQDLSEVPGANALAVHKILQEQYTPVIQKIRTLEKPVIAAVNGVAAGAGANIALLCDIVIAAESAYFTQPFSKIGLIPDSGGTYILPRLIGWQKASALMMLADKISAAEAEKAGMLYKVFPDNVFQQETMKIAERLSKMPTKSLAMIKQALHFSLSNTFEQQLEIEDMYQCRAAETHDYKEGVKAFLEKRQPVFKGE